MKFLGLLAFLLIMFLPLSVSAAVNLNEANQGVCDRFEADISKMAAIMEELRNRKDIKETRVAFGGIDTQIESADYWITYAAEALAYQRAQKYSSKDGLKNSLEVLRGKILKAKTEVGKALNE